MRSTWFLVLGMAVALVATASERQSFSRPGRLKAERRNRETGGPAG